jgi:hypothetical protein
MRCAIVQARCKTTTIRELKANLTSILLFKGLDFLCIPKPLARFKLSPNMETVERLGAQGTLPSSQHFRGVEGRPRAP